MTNDQAHTIARCLTPAQRSTILHMDEKPAMLGCSQGCAKRLSIAKTNRPALVTEVVEGDGWPNEYGLNADGLAVKAALERIAA